MPRRRDRGRRSKQALRIARRSTATFNQSIPLRHSPHETITSVKMAGLLGKKFPTPVGAFQCLSSAPHRDNMRYALITDAFCYSPPHGSLLHCRFVDAIHACVTSRNAQILIFLLPLQAPSSSTASTRSPLLWPTVSSTHSLQYPRCDLSLAMRPKMNLQEIRENKTADKLYFTADEYRNDPRNPNKNIVKPAH